MVLRAALPAPRRWTWKGKTRLVLRTGTAHCTPSVSRDLGCYIPPSHLLGQKFCVLLQRAPAFPQGNAHSPQPPPAGQKPHFSTQGLSGGKLQTTETFCNSLLQGFKTRFTLVWKPKPWKCFCGRIASRRLCSRGEGLGCAGDPVCVTAGWKFGRAARFVRFWHLAENTWLAQGTGF